MTTTATPIEHVSVPLEGLTSGAVHVSFGGGELSIGTAEPGMLVSGAFEGGVIRRSEGPGRIGLQPLNPGRPLVTWRPVYWSMGVTDEIPVDLRLDTGGNRSKVDLTRLHIRQLELHTGASETTARLPERGKTVARIDCGFASVNLEVPPGVEARVRGMMFLGSLTVDESRFARTTDGWESAGFEHAPNRVDLTISGAFGSVRVA